MSDQLANRHPSESMADGALKERRRARYAERLSESPAIELQRVVPGDDPVWEGVGALRRAVYVDTQHYLTPEVLDENGREYDEYDQDPETVHFAVLDMEGEVRGYARILTKGKDGQGLLPAEKAFDTRLAPKTIEISRLISDRSFPGGPLVTLALVRALKDELESNPEKYGAAVATLEPFLALHLDNMGIPIKTIIDVQDTPEYNSSNMLVEMDYTKIVEKATEMDPERKFSPVYPERLGPWFNDMKATRGIGRIALIHESKDQ